MRHAEFIAAVVSASSAALAVALSIRFSHSSSVIVYALTFAALALSCAALWALVRALQTVGLRLAMVPLYVSVGLSCASIAVFLLVLILAANEQQQQGHDSADELENSVASWLCVGLGISAIVSSLFALLIGCVLPLHAFPRPHGPFVVGSVATVWRDTARPWSSLPGGDDPSLGPRELRVRVWYPVSPVHSSEPYPSSLASSDYVDDGDDIEQEDFVAVSLVEGRLMRDGCPRVPYGTTQWLRALARKANLPAKLLSHLTLIRCRAHEGAPPFLPAAGLSSERAGGKHGSFDDDRHETGKLRVVIFSHGMYGWAGQNTALVEDLASYGVVVVAADHNGDCIDSDPFLCEPTPDWKANDDKEREFYRMGLTDRVQDISFILDRLAAIREDVADGSILAQIARGARIDRVGVVGHSFGGGTAVAWSARDTRCETAVALDGWVWPLREQEELGFASDGRTSQAPPLLQISASDWHYRAGQTPNRSRLAKLRRRSRHLILRNSDHHNFNDMPLLLAPFLMRRMKMIGKANAHRSVSAINALTIGWLLDGFGFSSATLTTGSIPSTIAQRQASTPLLAEISAAQQRRIATFREALHYYAADFEAGEGDPRESVPLDSD